MRKAEGINKLRWKFKMVLAHIATTYAVVILLLGETVQWAKRVGDEKWKTFWGFSIYF